MIYEKPTSAMASINVGISRHFYDFDLIMLFCSFT